MNKTALSMALMLALPAFAIAGPRSLAEMKSAARQAIPAAQTGARSVAGGDLKVLKQGSQYTVLGYANGGFAVIANDDRFAPVLGYSDGKVGDDAPLALQWWMDAVDESLERQLADCLTGDRLEVGYAAHRQVIERAVVEGFERSRTPKMAVVKMRRK